MNGIISNYVEIIDFISKNGLQDSLDLENHSEIKKDDKNKENNLNINQNISNTGIKNNKVDIKIESLDLTNLLKQTEKVSTIKNSIKELLLIEKKKQEENVKMLDLICHQQMETRELLNS